MYLTTYNPIENASFLYHFSRIIFYFILIFKHDLEFIFLFYQTLLITYYLLFGNFLEGFKSSIVCKLSNIWNNIKV